MINLQSFPVRHIYNNELGKDKLLKQKIYFCISLFFVSLIILLLIVGSDGLTGLVGYISSQAGYITEVRLTAHLPVETWVGFYGLALSVSGFSELLYKDIDSGTIQRSDIFFDCIQSNAPGGPEIYASTSSSLDFSSVIPATFAQIDAFLGCTSGVYCANNTYTQNLSVMVGINNISGVPSTYTYRYDANQSIFRIGALNISGQLAFFASVKSVQKGYNPNVTVNYQMLLPAPANSSQRYYFYNDPNDLCPGGGIGNAINASMWGYVTSLSNGAVISGANVIVSGYNATTDSNGFYNVSFFVLPGNYNVFTSKDGYNTNLSTVDVDFTVYSLEKNFSLIPISNITSSNTFIDVTVSGTVTDTSATPLLGAVIALGNATTTSAVDGTYILHSSLVIGQHPILAYLAGYDNYYSFLNFTSANDSITHNIALQPSTLYSFPTGPFPTKKTSDIQEIKKTAELAGLDYWIAPTEIDQQILINTFRQIPLKIYNFKTTPITVALSYSASLTDLLELDKTSLTISPDSEAEATVTIYGVKPIGTYTGTLTVSGDLTQEIPVNIEIAPRTLPVQSLFITLDSLKDTYAPGSTMRYKLVLNNLLFEGSFKVRLKVDILDEQGTIRASDDLGEVELKNSLTLIKQIDLPADIPQGRYSIRLKATPDNYPAQVAVSSFKVALPLYLYAFFGVPLWLLLVIISGLSFIMFNFFLYKHYSEKRKRYHLTLNTALLPKDSPRSIKLGKLAETNIPAFYDLDMLTTHAIIAGATGGGKSISAQVFIEEALLKNIAVVVFDPTAQWSGMLRKCDDKKMLSFYPRFGLKPSDARAFPGNVRQITNARQLIDLNKYVMPGQIQIFTMNKLDPSEIDLFISGVISSIFKGDPKEHPGLKTLIVFDEVHRLLPKFGGKGQGFLQIERACREFRKWGLGVMLVSQVLSDFVGEIKANINTEVLMRAAEENDLNRIKERYGLEALKSLVRADVGVAMIQNAEYNRGLPYFVALRPILHNTRRLSDEVLEKYNSYGEMIEDLQYQIEQLEQEKIDTFDMKMELKLVKDKLMTGNFTVVDIYLEGLKPRLQKSWDKLGKQPKKYTPKFMTDEEITISLAAAQKDRAKWEKNVKPASAGVAPTGPDPLAIFTKIVRPITFDNGIMISSLRELKDVLPNVDKSVFMLTVKDGKNDIAAWITKEVDAELGKQLNELKTKDEMIKILDEFEKQKKTPAEKNPTVTVPVTTESPQPVNK